MQAAWKATSDNTITVNFSSAPSSNSIKVLIYKSLVSATDNPTFTGVTVDNIQIGISGTNEIDTTTGNLTIDSAGGTVSIDDDVTISGTLDVTGEFSAATPSFDGPTQITGELTITGNTTITGDLNSSGDILLTGGGTITASDSSSFIGGSITIQPQTNTSAMPASLGGNVNIYGGNTSGASATAGSVQIDAGQSLAPNPNGSIFIGGTNADLVYIGRTGKTTTVNGSLSVLDSLSAATPSFTGPTTVTGTLDVSGEFSAATPSFDGPTEITGDLDVTGNVVWHSLFNPQTGTTYTLALSDDGKVITMSNSSANTLTIPKNSVISFPVGTQITIVQTGTGQTTLAPADGDVTIRSTTTLKLRSQYSSASIMQISTNEWLVIGDMAVI